MKKIPYGRQNIDHNDINAVVSVLQSDYLTQGPKVKEFEVKPIFKVQIAAGKRKIVVKSYNFKGLKNVERIHDGTLYKYYYGSSSTYKIAKENLLKAKKKGYNSAFLVAFKEGKKINVKEALKMN